MAPATLADRVRAALTGRVVREVSMFGGISFLVDDRIVVAARRDGDLLVRIDPSRRGALLARPGAKPATMGTGRPMGDGWLAVGAAGLVAEDLTEWLSHALSTHAEAPRTEPVSHPGPAVSPAAP
ncbi:MAG: TfoX/Sxy family protein [Dermatophilaceae bacterium]